MTIPPMQSMGAAMIIVQVISTSICTCCTSLVPRVMSEGAPNRPTSGLEKARTCSKTAPRRSRPRAMATRAPNQTAVIVATTWTRVMASISRRCGR